MASRQVNIVLVEDDPDDVYITKQILNNDIQRQFKLSHVGSINELITTEFAEIDIILLDLGLPDSDGLASVVQVVNHFREIPVIVLTGLNNEDVGEAAIQLGAEDYIPKDELSASLLSRSMRFSIERHGLLRKLRNMAHVDSLTLLSNRADFDERLAHHLEYALRHDTRVGLLMIDLDGFKAINDNLGHGAGDQVLAQFAARIKNRIRKSDVAARLGGDEFALLLHPVESLAACESVAQAKLNSINEPFLIYVDGSVKEVSIGMSVGIAIYPDHGETGSALKSNADKAMYEVKKHGKNNYHVYGDGS